MISRDTFLDIAHDALHNPRTGPYDVTPLHATLRAYPFRVGDDEVIPAVVLQFAVDHRIDSSRRRVISLSCSALGFSLWCGDRFTEGRLDEKLDVAELIEDVVHQVPAHNAEAVLEDLQELEGAYPYHAACHFWKAWHSHQGVCKHVAAALQWLEEHHEDGIEGALDVLEEGYAALMNPVAQDALDFELPDDEPVQVASKQQLRGELLALVAQVTAPVGGLTYAQYGELQCLLEGLMR